jgi:hypothetical protein
MPTNRRRRLQPRRSLETESPRILGKLWHGCDFAFLDYSYGFSADIKGKGDGPTREQLKAAWQEVGDELVEMFIAGCDASGFWGSFAHPPSPGRRPWGFWEFADLPTERPRHEKHYTLVPGQHYHHVDDMVQLNGGDWELEVDYLRRHHLLSPAECTALGIL